MLNFCDFIQVFVFTRNHHLNSTHTLDANLGTVSLNDILSIFIDHFVSSLRFTLSVATTFVYKT